MAFTFLASYKEPEIKDSETFTDIIKYRVASNPNKTAFRFLGDGENISEILTYEQLGKRAMAIGALLQYNGYKGDTVLMLFQPGLDYVSSFFACLYSGFVAIPAYPPRRNRGVDRVYSIIRDSGCSLCLTSASVYNDIQRNFLNDEIFSTLQWIIVDDIQDDQNNDFNPPDLEPEDVAFLQYTSGSTGEPKGVIVTQKNLLYNSEKIRQSYNHDENLVGMNWLPMFHDMGLIGTVLQPPYVGGESNLMAPVTFIRNPLLWLKGISNFKATTAGGPNFTYDYCVDKIKDPYTEIDLSSWKIAFSGAEPVRLETMKRFEKQFGLFGFKPTMYYPCYGLAEATLMVTGIEHDNKPNSILIDGEALTENRLRIVNEDSQIGVSVVSCGHTWLETKIEIVDPITLSICAEDEIGEIWITGPTVAKGYWNNQKETTDTFNVKLNDLDECLYMRSGDLGFLHNGELYVTGRLKDLIIIRGKNHYPGDIEFSIQNSIPELKMNAGAAFSITHNSEEVLVIAHEIERSAMRTVNYNELFLQISKVIAEDHELDVHEIVILKPGSVPMTSSGKIERRKAKFDFLKNELNIIEGWRAEVDSKDDLTESVSSVPSEGAIKEWIVQWIIRNKKISHKDIDLDTNIMSYGIDSLLAVTLETEISNHFGFQWHISSFMLNPTINKLAKEGMEMYNEEKKG